MQQRFLRLIAALRILSPQVPVAHQVLGTSEDVSVYTSRSKLPARREKAAHPQTKKGSLAS